MPGVSTQFSIQDKMTAKLNVMIQETGRLNSALEETDAISDRIDPGAPFEDSSAGIGAASRRVDQFNDKQEDAERGAKRVRSAWSGIPGIIRTAMAALGGKRLLDLADSMTTTRARLDLMNDGLQTTDELQNKIMQAANRSRAYFQTTADAVAKMGIMAGDAFSSNDELIEFAELINKQFTIAGTSASGIDAAMLQLTQAMSSGVLRGEELNSIFEQAPTIIQTIADYLGVPIGQIREMASEGKITATVVKNAMLASADEINAKFESMSMTFAQAWTLAKNALLEAFTPVLEFIGSMAGWIVENWSAISPVVYGVAAAVLAYAAATWIANGAATTFFTTLLKSPIFWIAAAIGIVVAAIYRWIQAMGGIKAAWLTVVNALLTAWDWVKIGFMTGVYFVCNLWDQMLLAFQTIGAAIQNAVGDMKVGVLLILQSLVNGAIDIINAFISVLNAIPFVSIDAIEHVTFGTTAQLENEAAKQARAADLAAYQDEIEANAAERDAALAKMKADAQAATAERQAEIDAARAAADAAGEKAELAQQTAEEQTQPEVDEVGRVGSVGEIEEDVHIAEEDLKFLRDVAEMRYVQNFVTLTPTVAMNASISEKVDVDTVVRAIETRLETEFQAAAEGVYS